MQKRKDSSLTERHFVFNQLFIDFVRTNKIDSQGKTYFDLFPNILRHYNDFELISEVNGVGEFQSFLDEVNDYLIRKI